MDQSLALNALAPYLALAKSATSPRAAADLITQATSAQNTYVFAELLQQPNIQALQGNEQFGSSYDLLKIFAWGTWEDYKGTQGLPELNDAQTLKLRLLSLLTIASSNTPKQPTSPSPSPSGNNLSYASLSTRLDLPSTIDLEHLITQAIYSNLLTATLNPAAQTVVITSVSPLRDLAPGSVAQMTAELAAWSGRCDSVLKELDAEIARVKAEAAKRKREEGRVERQTKAVLEAEKGPGLGRATRGILRGQQQEDDGEDEDEMDVDGGVGGKRRGGPGAGGALQGFIGRFSGRSGGR